MKITYEDINRVNSQLSLIEIKRKNRQTGKEEIKKYAPVKERIRGFRMLYPDGYISTRLSSFQDGICIIEAVCGYYDENGEKHVLGTGMAYENEKFGSINGTSCIENCETSAVGRALGMAGINGEGAEVATAEEVNSAIAAQEATKAEEIRNSRITPLERSALENRCLNERISIEYLCKIYKVPDLGELTQAMHRNINEHWDKEIREQCSIHEG